MATYTMTIEEIVKNDVNLFDFYYPIYREDFRETFEQLFIEHFLFDEIGAETVSKFKHLLKVKLNLIMPKYNRIYETQELEQRILDNYDVLEQFERTTKDVDKGISSTTNKNLFKDAPKTKIDIDKIDIVNSITKDEGANTSDNTSDGFETWKRTMTGNIGIQTDSDAILSYWKSLRNVTEEIFEKELSDLFMGVY